MKKYIIILLSSIVLFGTYACKDDNFTDRYADPSKNPTATVPRLMTGMFREANLFTMPWYWRYYTFEIPQIGRFAQTMGWRKGNGVYENSESYNNDRWKNFYAALTNYRALENLYNNSSEIDKTNNSIFYYCATIFLYDHLQQIVDEWGDAPFTEAGFLFLTNDIEGSKPSYDKAEFLYEKMMDDLKAISDLLQTMSIDPIFLTLLKEQDYINHGEVGLWQKYCNSLLLRMAVRVADNGPLTAKAQSLIKTILSDPAAYPVVNNNDENIVIKNQPPDLQAIEGGQHERGIRGGFETGSGAYNRASKTMLDHMSGGDPRIEIMFDTNSDGNYAGMDPLMDRTLEDSLFTRYKGIQDNNYFSAIDTATFSRNNMIPATIMTAAEVSFIKAEAIQKWGVSGDARDAFIQGVTQSIEYYYYINSMGDYRTPVPAPSKAEVTDFAASKWDNASNKLEITIVQKWLNFGILQMVQAWNEYRRTGYPVLTFLEDTANPNCPTPPYRLKYTFDEKNYNRDNYMTVIEKDTYYNKLFWAK